MLVLLAVGGLAVLLGGCTGLFSTPSLEPVVELNAGSMVAGGDPFVHDTWSLSRAADAIVVGRVVDARTVVETTPDGGQVFHTDAVIEVEQALKGAPPERVTVRTLGGQVGDLTMLAFGEPVFRVGETTIAFLIPDGTKAGTYAVCGAFRGKLTVEGERVVEMAAPREQTVARILQAVAGSDPGPDPHFLPLSDAAASAVWAELGLGPQAYRFEDRRWPGTSPVVRYQVNAPQQWIAPINAAADTWTVAGSNLVFQYAGTTSRTAGVLDGVNVIEARRNYGRTWVALATVWFRSGSTSGGPFFNIVEADIQVNLFYRWVIGSDPQGLDAQNVLTHELGHWISLGDLYRPEWSEMTMYGYVSPGETKKRVLAEPDRTGILHIYGRR